VHGATARTPHAPRRCLRVPLLHGQRARDSRIRRRHVLRQGRARKRYARPRLRSRPPVCGARELHLGGTVGLARRQRHWHHRQNGGLRLHQRAPHPAAGSRRSRRRRDVPLQPARQRHHGSHALRGQGISRHGNGGRRERVAPGRWLLTSGPRPDSLHTMPLLPFPTTETTLGNGLRVIVVETGFPDIVSLQIPVQTGSRNEVEPGKTGFAHFFEHMMFRGTDRFPPDAYQRILTRAGARQNAFTSDDYTNYHTTFSRDDLERVLEIEADRFQHLEYSEEDFRTEARAVLGEYNKNAADPTEKLFEVMRDHAYTTHTYKHTVMGFLRDIEDMPNQYAYSRTFFDRWYRPGYASLIIAGDVTPEVAIPLVEQYWGAWQPGHYTASIPREPEPAASVAAHVPWDTPTLPWITVAFHGPPFRATDHASAAADLLVDLWFGPTSTLYRQLVEQEQLADQLLAFNPQSVDPGLITIGARVKRIADLVPVRDAILLAAARARDSLVSGRRLDHAKTHLRYAFLRELDNTEAIAAANAQFVHYERTTETLEELFLTRSRITARDLRDVARMFLTDERLVMTTLSHDALPDAMRTRPSLPEPR